MPPTQRPHDVCAAGDTACRSSRRSRCSWRNRQHVHAPAVEVLAMPRTHRRHDICAVGDTAYPSPRRWCSFRRRCPQGSALVAELPGDAACPAPLWSQCRCVAASRAGIDTRGRRGHAAALWARTRVVGQPLGPGMLEASLCRQLLGTMAGPGTLYARLATPSPSP